MPETPGYAPCAQVIDRVDTAYLDCVSNNLALLLAQAGVADVRTPFAHEWALRTIEDDDGRVAVDLPPRMQDRSLRRFTGTAPRWRVPVGGADAVHAWSDELGQGRAVLVVGDAYHLPWVPYFGREHMRHGFVVEGIQEGVDPCLYVVDPYDNATQWGRATPLTTKVSWSDLGRALEQGSWASLVPVGEAQPVDPAGEIDRNCAGYLESVADGTVDRFLEQHRDRSLPALRELALQSWLLTRNRELHGLWLRDMQTRDGAVPPEFVAAFEADVLPRWRRLQEGSYLAVRRAAAGRSVPTSTGEALRAAVEAESALARSARPVTPQEVAG